MRRRFTEANDNDIILNSIYELTHSFDGDGNALPTFFNIDEITDNYGLTEKEVIDIAEANGYNVYRIPGGEDLVNFTIIAHENLSYGDVVRDTEVDIKELGDETEDSFNAEESYMEDYSTKDLYQDLKYDTENFTRPCTLSFDNEKKSLDARKILLKHYNSVETYANTFGHHQTYFIDIDEPKKAMKEGALDDIKVASAHHLVNVVNKNSPEHYTGREIIAQKLFRSRKEVDNFIDKYNDVLFDMKIDTNEYAKLKNGKDFIGTIYTVIIDKKDESLKEELKPWFMQQGENGEPEYLGFAKSQNDMIAKMVKDHRSDFIFENTYIDELDKDTYEYIKRDLSDDEIDELNKYFGIKEDLKESEEPEVYRGYKIIFHPGYTLWVNMRDYYKVFDPKGTLVGSMKTLEDAKALVDKRIKTREDIYEDIDNSLVGKKVIYKDEEHTIDSVEEDEGILLTLDNGKTISVQWCVENNLIFSDDDDVNALLDKFRPKEPEDEPEEKSSGFDPFKDASKQGTIDAQEDWEMYKPKTSPMYETVKKAISKNDYKEVPTAQPEKYAKAYKDEYDNLRGKGRTETTLSKYVGFIANTYPGNVDELIKWLKDAVTSIDVSCGEQMLPSVERKVEYFDNRDGTETKIAIQKNKQWSSWTATLTSKENILKDMPEEVKDWVVEKNSGTSIDDYETGKVYTNSKLTSNPVVIDLLYEFNFKLGSQPKNECLEEENKVEEVTLYQIDKDNWGWKHNNVSHESGDRSREQAVSSARKVLGDNIKFRTEYLDGKVDEDIEKQYFLCAVYGGYNCQELLADNIEVYAKNESSAKKEAIKIYKQEYNYSKEDNPYGLEAEIIKDDDLEEDIEKHEELNPKLFDGNELKPEVKEAIIKIADEFVKELGEDGITFALKDVVLLGSNVSYNYTKDSDLDIHLIADSSSLDCSPELYNKLYSAYRSIFNKSYDIKLKGIPAEIYVELDEPQAKSNGIYSLNSGWVKEPVQQDIPDLDKEAFDELFNEWEERYINLIEDKKVDEAMRRDKYYVVNQDCSDWFTSLKQAIKEIKAGYFGDERTIIYYISSEYTQEHGNDMSQLGIDDELMEFENCKLVKDRRK